MLDWCRNPRVALIREEGTYPVHAPFHPSTPYPEYPFRPHTSPSGNKVYQGVREAFWRLGLDEGNYGTPEWNPLGTMILEGDTVLLKPNFIRESHLLRPNEWEQVITHGSVIRAVLDFVFLALKGEGRVIIADGPQTDSDFDAICLRSGVVDVVKFLQKQGLSAELLDLRRDRWFQKGDVIYRRVSLRGDPAGYTTVDLGGASEFSNYALSGHFYGADYDTRETASFHTGSHHSYVLCRTALDADVVINLPKLKTHKKTGVTLSLKNMVGINGYRNCLPHHSIGTPAEGGDEFPNNHRLRAVESRLTAGFKRVLTARGGRAGLWARALKRIGSLTFGDTNRVARSGNWYGNDTAWRMVLDVNKALFHFDGRGLLRGKRLRSMTIVDGVVGGQGNGPVTPDPVLCGLIVAGLNPVAVDTVCTAVMGFDYRRVPVVARAWELGKYPLVGFGLESIVCVSNVPEWNASLEELERARHLSFLAHLGWQGRIERGAQQQAASVK